MKRVSREAKSSEAPSKPAGLRSLPLVLAAVVLSTATSACDIVQGYEDAGDSLFPEQSTHLAAPGLRLVSGHYRELGVIAGSEIYLLAREVDDATNKLLSMRYAEPRPCEIPGVGRFSATREPSRSAPLIAYFHDDARQGQLHFADANCKIYRLSFDEAQLPIGETERSLVIWAGSELWLATPESDSQESLATGVSDVIRRVFGGRNAVVAAGRLTLFDASWKEQGTFGDGVSAVLRSGQSLFYLDGTGAHRIVDESGALEDELLVEDACSLGAQDDTWVTLRAPCSNGKVLAIHEATGKIFELPFEADTTRLKLVPAARSAGLDPLQDPFWFFYLRSGETEETQDTLFVRTPAGDEHALGAHGTLRQLRLLESEQDTHGYALVDVAGETGSYIWWNAAGETRVLAENAMWRADRLIVDFDGALGNVAVPSGDDLVVLAERVPWRAFEYQDLAKKWTVLFHDTQVQGTGQLSVFPGSIDALEAASQERSVVAPQLAPVASNVVVFSTSGLNEVLSGVSYLTDFDPSTLTGRLEYRNLELRFTARVNSGVSDYVVANDEILYAIPYGPDAGIWLASGK